MAVEEDVKSFFNAYFFLFLIVFFLVWPSDEIFIFFRQKE